MALADIPFYGGYLQRNEQIQQQDANTLKQVGGLAQLQAALQDAEQKRQAFQREQQFQTAQMALPEGATPEQRIALASRFAGPADLLRTQQSSLDRQAQIKATQESAMARIQQAATTANLQHQDRLSRVTNDTERNAEIRRHNLEQEFFNQQAQSIAGQKLFYETGLSPQTAMPPTAAPAASTVQPAPQTPFFNQQAVPPSDAQAFGAVRDATRAGATASATVNRQLTPQETQGMQVIGQPPQAPVPTAPAQPTQAPSGPASSLPTMPPEIAALPPKMQAQWRLDQGKTVLTALSDDAIEIAAQRFKSDRTLPPNLGRGIQGYRDAARIQNRAAELAAQEGNTPLETSLKQIANKNSQGALSQVSRQEASIGAFEKTALANADQALMFSDKVDRTQSPVFNRWLRAGRVAISGDSDVRVFDAANATFVSEYAKVMGGGSGAAASTEGAQHRASELISTADNPTTYRNIIGQLKVEMHNRMQGFKDQKAELMAGMGGAAVPTHAPAPTPAAVSPTPKSATTRGGATVSNW